MARKKVSLQWIANDSTRRVTFKKRRKGLMKKASELATLCDVDACVVVYGEGEAQPEVWPDVARAARVLARFRAMPELDQCKKMMDMEGFLGQLIDKHREQLHKARRENRERETTLLLHDAMAGRRPGGLAGLSVEEIAGLGWMVENLLHSVRGAIDRFQGQGAGGPGGAADAAAAAAGGRPPAGALRRPPAGRDDDAGGAAAPAGGLADGRGPGRRRPRRAGLQRLRRWARELRWIRRRRNLQRRRRRHLQRRRRGGRHAAAAARQHGCRRVRVD